jgi:hypothetical protein
VTGGQIPENMKDVPPGWWAILGRLHAELTALAPDYLLDSVLVRPGGLRVLVVADGGTNRVAVGERVRAAEARSRGTCRSCGARASGLCAMCRANTPADTP